MCFEINSEEEINKRKRAKFKDLVERAKMNGYIQDNSPCPSSRLKRSMNGYKTTLLARRVGSRGV